jgi:ribosomal protein S18 acetylase RimI-like enzyme
MLSDAFAPPPTPSPESDPAIHVRPAREEDTPALVALWDACGLTRAHNHGPTDIAVARRDPASEVLVGTRDGRIVCSAMTGFDGHRGWVYYVAADPDARGEGLGRRIMEAAEQWLLARGAWKLQLMVRGSNKPVIGFYEALGYAAEDTVVMSKRLRPMPHIE